MPRPDRTDLALLNAAGRAAHERTMGATRSARKRARDGELGRPDGRTLDAALSTAVCYLVQHHLELSLTFVTRCAVAYCVGHGCCRLQSRQAVRRHMERRDLGFIEATVHRATHGLEDLWVLRQRAADEARLKAAASGIRILPRAPQAVVIEPSDTLPRPVRLVPEGPVPVTASA